MKKYFLIPLLFWATMAIADDGGTLNFREWTYSNIYVKEPNDKIALRKELMEVDTDSLKATFVFENTTDEDVVVDCAFPIVLKTRSNECYCKKGNDVFYYDLFYRGFKNDPKFESLSPLTMLSLVSGKILEEEEMEGGVCRTSITFSELNERANGKLKKWNFDEYSKYISGLNISAKKMPPFVLNGCSIIQDGSSVQIENVGMESEIVEVDAKYQTFDLIVTLHFHHKLKFPKGKTSVVVVSHDIETFKSCGTGTQYGINYGFTYNISTGGTWKGDIESFIVMTPFEMKSSDSDFSVFTVSHNIYYKKDYKPRKNEVLQFSLEAGDINWTDDIVRAIFPKKRNGFSANNIKSFGVDNLKGLFDGDVYSYISMKDWQNSWIEFDLTDYVVGPLCVNGQSSNCLNEMFYDNSTFDERLHLSNVREFQDSVWNNANRVKTMEFVNSKSSEKTVVSLTDEYTALASFDGWNTSHNSQRVHLFSPGSYRVNFKEVYKGNADQETGLSEMWFLPIDTELVSMFEKDAQSQNPIFQSAISKYFSYKPFRYDWGKFYSYNKLPKHESKSLDSLYDFPASENELDSPYEAVHKSQKVVSSENIKTTEIETSVETDKKTDENGASVRYALFAGIVLVLTIAAFVILRKRNIKK